MDRLEIFLKVLKNFFLNFILGYPQSFNTYDVSLFGQGSGGFINQNRATGMGTDVSSLGIFYTYDLIIF